MVKTVNLPDTIIIGGGIGGLSAAIALEQLGGKVKVFERASKLKEMGAGIVLAANAMKALEKLGVADQVIKAGSPVKKAEIRTWDGKLIVNVPTDKQAEQYGSYSYLIYRPELQRILYKKLNSGTLELGKKLVRLEEKESYIETAFGDGSKFQGDFLIGADGAHSEVRNSLFESMTLRYSGISAFRGISYFDDPRFPVELGGGFEAWGHGKRFGYSHLGEGRIFWFAAINAPQGTLVHSRQRKKTAMELFKDWWQPIQAVIRSTEESDILTHDIFDRRPIKTWSKGIVTLLGDAAHPMLPNLGQGGAQAMEDAIVLARCLKKYPNDIRKACSKYEEIRIPRTTKIVHGSRLMGNIMQLEHTAAVVCRNMFLRIVPDSIQIKRLKWVVGHEL
ncbi:FAD-dependent monooxygenase [Bacillus sp. JJ1122]|uniref:FAD-dependent monooxygenase n=1 Tax=Bacillus sp. JJ1122 TaxID=3122951 RepID=UPI002FFDB2F4